MKYIFSAQENKWLHFVLIIRISSAKDLDSLVSIVQTPSPDRVGQNVKNLNKQSVIFPSVLCYIPDDLVS